MREMGLEILIETARFWMSRLEVDDGGVFHLHDTVGPDELDRHGRDNGFGSLMCRRHLRIAGRWVETLRAEHPDETRTLEQRLGLTGEEVLGWLAAADGLCAPMIPGTRIPLQDEFLLEKEPLSFDGLTADEAFAMRHTHRVVKQADIVMAMYLLQDEFDREQMRDAYDFYEPMTLHFSSLSYNAHSIVASMLGRKEQAYDYFLKAAGLDLDDLRNAAADGLHAAALGGTWNALAYGFLGLRLDEAGLVLEPRLPDAWEAVELRLVYRGYTLRVRATHDRVAAQVEGESGAGAAVVTINGTRHVLSPSLRIDSVSRDMIPS